MRRPGKSKDERTRTFTGCRTCRSRHAKCDEGQPECGVCRRLGIPCGGYAPRLFWVTDDSTDGSGDQTQSHKAPEYRFQMFTEEERRVMSKELSACAKSGTELDHLLAQIDGAYNGSHSKLSFTASEGFAKGPFGVFSAQEKQNQLASDKSLIPDPTDTKSIGPVTELIDVGDPNDEGAEDIPRTDWLGQLSGIGMDDFSSPLGDIIGEKHVNEGDILDPSILLDPGFSTFHMDFDTNPGGPIYSNMGWMSPTLNQTSWTDPEEPEAGVERNPRSSVPRPRSLTPSREISNIPEHAETLLRYYKQHSQSTIDTIRGGSKSALQTIFLPCALKTFSELILWNTTSHTRLAILPTLCAHSAFLLHRSGTSPCPQGDWWTVGTQCLKKAQTHLQQALQHELTGPHKATYEELLMAILALAMTSFYQNTRSANIYLLDAERLIRLYGFEQAHQCNDARLLHHMYTHLRIFSESVSSFDQTPSFERGVGTGSLSIENSRAFRVAENSLNTGLDSTLEKSREQGLRDIHLESQARWSRTMYPMIYGIPESIMTLVSQTVSLANDKIQLETIASKNPQTSRALAHHIKTLEQSIWSWSIPSGSQVTGPVRQPLHDGLEGGDHEGLLDHHSKHLMTMALHQGLIIYFYRRVHGVNAMLLQDAVFKALHYLESCVEDMIRDHDLVPSLAWATFIAASEAVTIDLQEKALKLLDIIDSLGFFFTPKPTKETVSRIWELRKQTGDLTIGWSSVMDK